MKTSLSTVTLLYTPKFSTLLARPHGSKLSPTFMHDLIHPLKLLISTLKMIANHLRRMKALGNNEAIDFDSQWAVLSSSLREIHTKNASKLSFEELYRNAYKLVLKKKGETLYNCVKDFEESWLANEIRPRILKVLSTSLLVGSIGATAITTVNEKRVAGEKLLKALKQAWEDHNLCMNMTTDVLMYMVSGNTASHDTQG